MSLFIVEGIDGSGKTTQVALLEKRLKECGYDVMVIKFPNYDDKSSGPIKMYLNGELGSNPDDVNPYAASSFYAVDRYASFKKTWEKPYNEGTVIISDRYVVSNIIHQSSKLPKEKRREYFDWLYDFEYGKIRIPIPNISFLLDVPPAVCQKQIERRNMGDESKKDIHERNSEYLVRCHEAAMYACELFNIRRIECFRNGKLRPIEEINDVLFYEIKKAIDG